MFVGHFGPGFATQAARTPPSLGAALLATQLVDVAWAGFIMTGIEHGRIEPGFVALSSLRLDHMPWTHSLPMAIAWSVGGALVYRLLAPRAGGWGAAMLIGLCVFSHWLLDLIVHAPDLELWIGGPKVGLGWWDRPALGIGAEAFMLFAGFALYMAFTKPNGLWGRIAPWLLLALLCAAYAVDKLGPEPQDLRAQAPQALAAYLVVAAFGFWLDRVRAPARASITEIRDAG